MIKIYNNRIVHTTSSNKKTVVPDNQLPVFLGDEVQFDDKLTFHRLFNLLCINAKIFNVIYAKTMGFCTLEDFLSDFEKEIEPAEKNDHKNEFLEVYFHLDIWKYSKKDGFEMTPYYGFHMIKLKDEDGDNMPYSISFQSISNFKKHKIKVCPDIKFTMYDTTLKGKALKENMRKVYEMKVQGIKLYDVIEAILNEITWHGKPVDRDARAKNLMDITYEFNETKK